ncbi:MAG TPA: TIGR00341 family protein [Xenococcaceae cyanobacterium]
MILLGQNWGYFRHIKRLFNKYAPVDQEDIKEAWQTHSGDWHWLKEKPVPIASINRTLWRASVPSFSFHFMLGLSSIIATLGLLGNNVAIIIGAMIIAPLIGPIMGITYSSVMSNRRLLRRSSLTLLTGVILSVVIAWLTTLIIGLKTINPEVLARANPTLLDLGIALAAGAAGAFANSRRRIADALPGVAIAVALVPPLSVIGIGLALQEIHLAIGSSLLFLTNLIGIIFSGGIVFLCQSYGNVERAKQGLVFSICVLVLLALPLSFSLRELLIKQNVSRNIQQLLRYETTTFAEAEIRSIQVQPQQEFLLIDMEIATPLNSISQAQINLVQDFLQARLNNPVKLRVKIIPVKVLEAF